MDIQFNICELSLGIRLILPQVYKVFGSPLQLYNVTNLSSEEYKLSNSKDAFAFDLLNYTQMCSCTCTHTHSHMKAYMLGTDLCYICIKLASLTSIGDGNSSHLPSL